MYCPKCRSEYVEGVRECDDCGSPLVQDLPSGAAERPPRPARSGDLVTVLATGNGAVITVAKSVLEDAGIPCSVKGEGLQSLFGFGIMGTGFNPVVGPIQIQVPSDYERDATALLQGIEDDRKGPGTSDA